MEAAKKELILEEAGKLFARHGFKKVTIDDVAQASRVAKGTVYLACESKEDLFYQVLHRELRAWTAAVARTIDVRLPGDQLLATMSETSILFLETHPLVRDLMFGHTYQMLPNWADRLRDLRMLGVSNVVEALKLGIRQGIFRDNVDIELVASLLQDLVYSSYLFHSQGTGRPEQLRTRRIAALDLVLNGLRIRPA